MYALLTLFFMFHGTSSNYEIHKYFLKILSKSKLMIMLYIFLKKSKLSCYTFFLKFLSNFKNTLQIYITMFCFKSFIFTHGTHTCKRKIPYLNFIFTVIYCYFIVGIKKAWILVPVLETIFTHAYVIFPFFLA